MFELQVRISKLKVNRKWFDPQFPNLAAILDGRVSGNITDWPAIKGELVALLEEAHFFDFE